MYKNKSNPSSLGNSSIELSKIVSGSDIFNSEVLYKITKFPVYKLKSHKLTVSGMSPNSLACELFGDQIYSWILILFNPKYRVFKYEIGTEIVYPELSDLINYLNS